MTECATTVLVLSAIKRVVCATAHAHWKGNACLALLICEWIIIHPLGKATVKVSIVCDMPNHFKWIAHTIPTLVQFTPTAYYQLVGADSGTRRPGWRRNPRGCEPIFLGS